MISELSSRRVDTPTPGVLFNPRYANQVDFHERKPVEIYSVTKYNIGRVFLPE